MIQEDTDLLLRTHKMIEWAVEQGAKLKNIRCEVISGQANRGMIASKYFNIDDSKREAQNFHSNAENGEEGTIIRMGDWVVSVPLKLAMSASGSASMDESLQDAITACVEKSSKEIDDFTILAIHILREASKGTNSFYQHYKSIEGRQTQTLFDTSQFSHRNL